MPRGVIDTDGLVTPDVQALRDTETPSGLPFSIAKIGHVVLIVQDLEKSVDFYTRSPGLPGVRCLSRNDGSRAHGVHALCERSSRCGAGRRRKRSRQQQ